MQVRARRSSCLAACPTRTALLSSIKTGSNDFASKTHWCSLLTSYDHAATSTVSGAEFKAILEHCTVVSGLTVASQTLDLYLFSRYGVLPGHAHKAFVPDTGMFTGPQYSWPLAPSPLAGHEDTCPENAPIAVHAKVIDITDGYLELDVDVTEDTATTVLTPQFLESPAGKRSAEEHTVGLTLQKQYPNDRNARRRIPWDYIAFVPYHLQERRRS